MASKFAWNASFWPHERIAPCRARPARIPSPLVGRPISAPGASIAAQLADRLAIELEIDISEGQISRIERGETPYSQDILEALAGALRCQPADLLVRDPTQTDAIWSLWETLKPVEQAQAVEILKTLRKTGTDS